MGSTTVTLRYWRLLNCEDSTEPALSVFLQKNLPGVHFPELLFNSRNVTTGGNDPDTGLSQRTFPVDLCHPWKPQRSQTKLPTPGRSQRGGDPRWIKARGSAQPFYGALLSLVADKLGPLKDVVDGNKTQIKSFCGLIVVAAPPT